MLLGFWSVTAFFVNAIYFCNFRSYLMQAKYEEPIDSDNDLLMSGYELYMAKGTISDQLYGKSPFENQRHLFRNVQAKQSYFTYVNGNVPRKTIDDLVRNGGALLFPKLTGLSMMEEYDKILGYVPFRVGKWTIFPFIGGFVVRYHSQWKHELDMVIFRLQEAGIVDKILRDSVKAKYLVNDNEEDTAPKAFLVSDVFGCCLILMVGLGFSLMLFTFEVFKFNCCSLYLMFIMHLDKGWVNRYF